MLLTAPALRPVPITAPTTPTHGSGLGQVMYNALAVFYVAVTLERYYEMAMALSTMGMAHRALTGNKHVMLDCYRHAAGCPAWSDDVALAEFLGDASPRLEREVLINS